MKVKQLLLALIWLIFTPLASGSSSASEEQPKYLSEVKLEGTVWAIKAFIEDQIANSPIGGTQNTLQTTDESGLRSVSASNTASVYQSGPSNLSELETVLDAYFAEQMHALHVPGVTFVLIKNGDIDIKDNHMN